MRITLPDSTTETLSYDDNGQLVKSEKSTGETTAYEWNDQGMLVKVILPNGEPVEYEYDGNRRLTGRRSADGVDQFVQSGWDIVTKMDDVGKRTYYTGMSAVAGEENQTYFHYNHRGDTVLVTDSEGNTLNNFSYEAYGRPTNSEGIPINALSLKDVPNLFVGGAGIRYDTKTNLHYMRFRWFSSSQMRFISPDLLMDLNRYAYVSGNPVRFIDKLGLKKHTPADTIYEFAGEVVGNAAQQILSPINMVKHFTEISGALFYDVHKYIMSQSYFTYIKEVSQVYDIPVPVIATMLHFENETFGPLNPITKPMKQSVAHTCKGTWSSVSIGIAQIKPTTAAEVDRYFGRKVLKYEQYVKSLKNEENCIFYATGYLAYLRDRYVKERRDNSPLSTMQWTTIITMYNTGFIDNNQSIKWGYRSNRTHRILLRYMKELNIDKLPFPEYNYIPPDYWNLYEEER